METLCQKRALECYGLDPEKWGVNVQPYSGMLYCHQLTTCVAPLRPFAEPVLKEYPLNLVKRKLWICVCCYCIRLTGKLRRLHGVVGTSRTHHGPGFAGRWPSHSRLHDREQESLGYLRVLRVLSLQGLCALSFTEMQNPTIASIIMVIFRKSSYDNWW